MSARHRGKRDRPPVWRLLAAVVVPIAGIGLLVYVGARHPSAILILLAASEGVIVIQAAHRLVLHLANQQLLSAQQVADRLSLTAQVIGAVTAEVATVGTARGWMHGTFRDGTLGVLALYIVGSPIWWFGGKRRFIAVLSTRSGPA